MDDLQHLKSLLGRWTGTNKLWMSPDDDPHVSPTAAVVTLVARGKFVRLDYTWEYEREPQEGSVHFGTDQQPGSAIAVWIDSWHMGKKYMPSSGTVGVSGAIDVRGSYAAPPGPDWGWRTVLEPGRDEFRLIMYNISPEGKEDLAVEAVYRRKG